MKRIVILHLLALCMLVACKNTSANKATSEESTASETTENTIPTEAVVETDIFPLIGDNAISFVPDQWHVIKRTEGDLNNDNLADVALVVEKDDPKNVVAINDSTTLNTNPRALLIVLKQKNGSYRLAAKNNNGFVEPAGSKENDLLIDPLENSELVLKNNSLVIDFQYSYLGGTWVTTFVKYVFRYQNDRFELIGAEEESFSKSTGEETNRSFNLSTNRLEITTGGNAFDETKNKPKKQVKKKVYDPKPVLDSLSPSPYLQLLYD